MFDLGTQELIIIFIVAFLVFGPKKLPELGRTLGKGIRELKAAMRGVKESIEEAGKDVNEEIKAAKSDLEDSVYKSIEANMEGLEKKPDQGGEADETLTGKDTPASDEEEGKKEKETDKDG